MHQSMSPLRATRPEDASFVVQCVPQHFGALPEYKGIGGQSQGEIGHPRRATLSENSGRIRWLRLVGMILVRAGVARNTKSVMGARFYL